MEKAYVDDIAFNYYCRTIEWRGSMKLLLMVLLTVTFNAHAQTCDHDDHNFRCVEYVKNYDSDTITVDIKNVPALIGKKISVRVKGIDSPEVKGKLPCEKEAARTAKKLVESLLKKAKRIDLEEVDRDKYFRILAKVKVDGQDLSQILLKNNLAYNYNGGTKEKLNWCNRSPANK